MKKTAKYSLLFSADHPVSGRDLIDGTKLFLLKDFETAPIDLQYHFFYTYETYHCRKKMKNYIATKAQFQELVGEADVMILNFGESVSEKH